MTINKWKHRAPKISMMPGMRDSALAEYNFVTSINLGGTSLLCGVYKKDYTLLDN